MLKTNSKVDVSTVHEFMGKLASEFAASQGMSLEYTVKKLYRGEQVKVHGGGKGRVFYDNLEGIVCIGKGGKHAIYLVIMNGSTVIKKVSDPRNVPFTKASLMDELQRPPSKRACRVIIGKEATESIASAIIEEVIGTHLSVKGLIRGYLAWVPSKNDKSIYIREAKKLYNAGLGGMVTLKAIAGL